MKRIKLSELDQVLTGHGGAVIVTMVTRTTPPLLARSRRDKSPTAERFPMGVEKLALGRFVLKADYERNVRAQRKREGHKRPDAFRRDKLWNGHGRRVGAFAEHTETGEIYVVARPQSDYRGRPIRIWERWIDLSTGQDLDARQIEELARDYLRDRPATNEKQELTRTIPYRTYRVAAIHSVQVGGEVLVIVPDQPAHMLG